NRDDCGMYFQRSGAVHKKLAERMIVVETNQLPEDAGALLDVSDVLPLRFGGENLSAQDRDDLIRRLDAAHHRQRNTGGKNRIEKCAGVADQKISRSRQRLAGVTEIGE